MKRELFIRSRFNYDPDTASTDSGLQCDDETLAQQQFAEETDINVLVRRFNLTGELPQGVRMPTYADFSEVYDFHSAANAIAEANEAFAAMPAEIRDRFGNDPAAFVAFCSNDDNRKEAERMGLVPSELPLNTAPAVDAGTAPSLTPATTGTGNSGSTTSQTGTAG